MWLEGSLQSHRHIILSSWDILRKENIKSQLDGFPIKVLHITGRPGQPNVTETQIRVGMDTRRDFVIRERQPTAWGHLKKILNKEQNRNGYGHEPSIWID